MKKLVLLWLMVTIAFYGCSTDSEQEMTSDELLTGTEWRYGEFDNDDYLDLEPNQHVSVDDFSSFFPDVNLIYTEGSISSTETYEDKSSDIEKTRAKLNFEGNTCRYYEDSGYTLTETIRTEYFTQTLTYAPQSYTSSVNSNVSLEVKADGIYIYYIYSGVTGLQRKVQTYRALNNYQYIKEWEKSNVVDTEKTYNNIKEETFNYQRTGNEIVLTNASKKWIGTLDTEDWTLTFIQIVPEKKELPQFHLK